MLAPRGFLPYRKGLLNISYQEIGGKRPNIPFLQCVRKLITGDEAIRDAPPTFRIPLINYRENRIDGIIATGKPIAFIGNMIGHVRQKVFNRKKMILYSYCLTKAIVRVMPSSVVKTNW